MTTVILAVYILALVLGGLVGYLKAGSVISLIVAAVFAAVLAFCAWGPVPNGLRVAQVVQGALVVVFVIRFLKTRKTPKSTPAIVMLALTLLALVLELALA